MALEKLTKSRPLTEIETVIKLIEDEGIDFNTLERKVETTTAGIIISFETSNVIVQNILKSQGFAE